MGLPSCAVCRLAKQRKMNASKPKCNPHGWQGITFYEEISDEGAPNKKGITATARYEQLHDGGVHYLCRRPNGRKDTA